MLTVKKTEGKKLILYLCVIGATLFGTVFFIYKNYLITSSVKNIVENTSNENGANFGVGENGQADAPAQEEGTKTEPQNDNTSGSVPSTQEKIDLDLFSNAKFLELNENSTQVPNFEVGKKNPFAP